jgi:type I restriction enzyme R subunit
MSGLSDESEQETRKNRINRKLEAAGWHVVKYDQSKPLSFYSAHALEEYPTANGPVDYALVVNGQILAVVEAKRLTVGPQNVLVQAQRYARGVTDSPFDFDGFRVPFIYSTNGEIFWFQDVRKPDSRSRRVAVFHTPGALREMLAKDTDQGCEWFSAHPNRHQRLRPYQIEANDAVEDAICAGKRRMLLAMATGTGKTYTIVSQIYRLMKSGLAKRILFLVDRRALAAQAVQAFATFDAEPGKKFDQIYEVYSQRFKREDFDEDEKFDFKVLPNNYLTNPQPGHAFVYVCTIQRMRVSLFGWESSFEALDQDVDDESDASRLYIPIHAFDVIIADECHRGYTAQEISKWREVLEHFDAVQIGLTATPAAHTTAYFKDIVYRYDYERAVREGYLVDWDAVRIKSDVRINGIFLREGETVGLIDTATGVESLDTLEDEREFDTTEIERKVTSPDSNRKIIEEIAKYAREHEEHYNHFPKTLIFAANDLPHTSHCDTLVDICRDVFGRGDAFVQKITGNPNVDRPLQKIREFRNRPNPGIVVTRDMLTTGVDIPALEFLVFLRPVKSRILWEQMIGRCTRRCEEINKTHFTVFDCFNGGLFEYFKDVTVFEPEAPLKATRSYAEIIEDIYQNKDRRYNVRVLVKRLQRIEKELSGVAREQFARFIPGGDMRSFARDLSQRVEDDFVNVMKILRDPEFLDLLVNYPKPKRGFVVAYETEDEVSSAWMVKDPNGGYWKPEDYLVAFSRFVKENPEHIAAIEILLDRPKDWSTDALSDLKAKLKATREHFSEENLRKAHKLTYNKVLVDIISMIKHAAHEDEPLFTAEERVSRAFEQLTYGKMFTDDQLKWLGLIRSHLIINLTIAHEDFDILPIFQREGGWMVANKVFENELESLLQGFNEAVAT